MGVLLVKLKLMETMQQKLPKGALQAGFDCTAKKLSMRIIEL
jgi:hypothetical protein